MIIPKKTQKPTKILKPHRFKSTQEPEWAKFNDQYNEHYSAPTISQLNPINHYFNIADVTYEWSVASFADIPSEWLKDKYRGQESDKVTKRFPGKTYVPFELVNELPEVIFLGRTNAGKSTLLNNITTVFQHATLEKSAKMSSKAGFTKTLNCFNIGNRFRLIDSPGYGFNSSAKQGDVTMEYLRERKELKRSYLLIPGDKGFSDLDLGIIEFMRENGIPFEIVFTKMDRVRNLTNFKEMVTASGILNYPTLPQLIFVNSAITKTCSKRYGIDRLRFSLFQSCSLNPLVKPTKKKVN